MTTSNFLVGQDLRRQIAASSSAGRQEGKKFVQQHKQKDKVWFGGALDEIEKKVSELELPKAVEDVWADADKTFAENPVSKTVEKIADPTSVVTDYLKQNLPSMALRASISCAVFHEVKNRGIKRAARRANGKWEHSGKMANYVCDIMLPTPLYGPFFLFLVKKARQYAVYKALSAVGLQKDD